MTSSSPDINITPEPPIRAPSEVPVDDAVLPFEVASLDLRGRLTRLGPALDAMTRERLQDELVEIWSRTGLTVLFVTHAIEEAIFLADRVVVMSPGPGRIDSEYVIDLPRPRDTTSPEFNQWRRLLSSQLHSHHGRKAG